MLFELSDPSKAPPLEGFGEAFPKKKPAYLEAGLVYSFVCFILKHHLHLKKI